jgi:regulator of protease activity HflC (stomatin/prohibitin superfamily)
MTTEKTYHPLNGWLPLFITIAMVAGGTAMFIAGIAGLKNDGGNSALAMLIGGIVVFFLGVTSMSGFMAIAPNQARVLLLFGKYKGSALESGFFWVNPFFSKKKISLRIRNFETGSVHTPERKSAEGVVQAKSRTSGRPSKVNDRDGNPIDISAVVVWRVVNTAEALFEVDDFEDFVSVQSEAALRNMASRHPYDSEDHEISLRGSTSEISDQLKADIGDRLDKAGVEVIEARISHLAYSPEIAAAMLQRQQAQAVVAARTKIVEGAVGMVEMALDKLSEKGIIELDDERRAAMVSNLLVVLCSDRHTQPVVNTGSLYT